MVWNSLKIFMSDSMSGLLIIFISIVSYFGCIKQVNTKKYMFLEAGLWGKDYGSKSDKKLPEAMGFIAGTMYMMALILYIAVPFLADWSFGVQFEFSDKNLTFYLAGLLSICSMIMLGFADDVLNLRWKYKLIFPMIASLPLLIIYIVNKGSTHMNMPIILKYFCGPSINLGILHYIFIVCLAIFCTNAINIYAGINGLEVGQSIIIAISLVIFSFVETFYFRNEEVWIIYYLLMPFIAVSLGLYRYNKYPATIFVGDTFCYFAGMVFSVGGILGHCSKTLLLFFMPQIVNFLISTPQLFKWYPCPRHRLPFFNPNTGLREASTNEFVISSLDIPGCVLVGLLGRFGYAKLTTKPGDKNVTVIAINLTLINVVLKYFGPMSEKELFNKLMRIQLYSSLLAFFTRYPLTWLLDII